MEVSNSAEKDSIMELHFATCGLRDHVQSIATIAEKERIELLIAKTVSLARLATMDRTHARRRQFVTLLEEARKEFDELEQHFFLMLYMQALWRQ